MDKQAIKNVLSDHAKKLFEEIDSQQVLGATTHIKMIADMFLDITTSGLPAKKMLADIRGIANYFIKTRGESSQAISNAILLMTNGLTVTDDAAALIAQVAASVSRFREQSRKNTGKIDTALWNLLAPMHAVLLFDYSSTVNSIGEIAQAHGHTLHCYIPESRALDGGRPYVKSFLDSGHRVYFIPDSALYYYIQKCDAAFIGSETCYPDGTSFNTIGSELLGLLCKTFRVPLYVPTPLLKLDMRALQGYQKPPIIDNLTHRLACSWPIEVQAAVDFTCPELVAIPPEYITAFITEEGVIPPWGMYAASLQFSRQMMGVGL